MPVVESSRSGAVKPAAQSAPADMPIIPPQVVSKSIEPVPPRSEVRNVEKIKLKQPVRNLRVTPQPEIAYHNTLLVEDTRWRGEVQVNGWVTIPPNVTLTVEAGTIVRFQPDPEGVAGGGILVQGRLLVKGLPEKPVIFTGAYQVPAAGDWQGIVFLATEKKNIIESSIVESATAGIEAHHSVLSLKNVSVASCDTGFRFRETYASILGTSISSCREAVFSSGSELDIRDASITGNKAGISATGGSLLLSGSSLYGNDMAALSVEKSRIKISGSSFTLNRTGLLFDGCDGSVVYNRILKNREVGMTVNNSRLKVNANEVSQNGAAGIRIAQGANTIWGNSIFSNEGCALEYSGVNDLPAIANWWGDMADDSVRSKLCSTGEGVNIQFRPVLLSRPKIEL